jgi:glycerol-3-phosphate acyltransferase PlsY
MNDLFKYALIPILAYFLGSIPFGLISAKIFAGVDVRRIGSGNIGATNVRRIAGNKLGGATLLADMTKGALPVTLALLFSPPGNLWQQVYPIITLLAAFMGHIYPIYSGFGGGGKGVATAGGAVFALSFSSGCIAILVFVGIVVITRRVSLGSLGTAGLLPLIMWINTHSAIITLGMLIVAVVIWWRHKDNIERLRQNNEPALW